MKISILGGTGDIGEGLALRLAQKHDVIVGSRDEIKAIEAADHYNKILTDRGLRDSIKGMSNRDAAKNSEVVILAVKFQFALQTVQGVLDVLSDQIVVSPIVPMSKTKLCAFTPPEGGSAAKYLCKLMPPSVKFVSTFHTLPAARLADLDEALNFDLIVCADDEEAKKTVMGLVSDLDGVRPLDGGSLEESKLIEALTPLLINLAIKNKMKPLSIKFV